MRLPALLTGLLLASSLSATALANVVVTGTRVIYPAQAAEISVQLDNAGKQAALVQTWLEQETPENTATVPFVVMPPLFRIEPGNGQLVRIVHTGEPLPADRESLFYFNVLDIPPRPESQGAAESGNYLQFSIRSRLKFFYRPQALQAQAAEAYKRLQWRLTRHQQKWRLVAENPTPYYITVARVGVHTPAKQVYARTGEMLAPFSSGHFELEGADFGTSAEVRYETINDFGGIAAYQSMAAVSR